MNNDMLCAPKPPCELSVGGGGERKTMQTNAYDALEILCSLSGYLAIIGKFMFCADWAGEEKPTVNCLEQNISEIVRLASVCEKNGSRNQVFCWCVIKI